MLKLLVKKQLMEVFRAYFYNSKKNTSRSKAGIIVMFGGFIIIMAGVLGGTFAFLAFNLCAPLVEAGIDWLYFAVMGLLGIFLGVFGSVFNTFSTLYLAKDNDFLLSMPIPVKDIMVSRLINVYLLSLMYSIVVLLPSVIVYWITVPVTPTVILGGIVLLSLIPLFVTLLSCLLGWCVAKVSLRLKNKSLITVLLSLAFFAAYYFLYFKAQGLLSDVIANAAVYGENIKGAAYGIYLFGRIGTGDLVAILLFTVVILALTAAVWMLLQKTFLSISTATGAVKKTVYHEKTAQQKTPGRALLGREITHFLSNPNYMLNCGLGIILLPALGIFMLIKGRELVEALESVFSFGAGVTTILICVALCMVVSMNDMVVPSVSLEGKSIWLAQSLPVRPWQVLKSKLMMQLLLTGIPLLFALICVFGMIPDGVPVRILAVVFCLVNLLLLSLFGLFLGLKFANVKWTNEITPIKQGMAVLIIIFGSWIYCAAIAGLYLWQGYKIGPAAYLGILIALDGLFCVGLYLWLRRQGCRKFAEL